MKNPLPPIAGLCFLSVAAALASCSEPTSSVAQIDSPLLLMSSDTVYWDGNELEYTEAGTTYRWVRDQQQATKAWMYVDNELQLTVDVGRQSGQVSSITFTDASNDFAFDTDASGEIVAVSGAGGCTPSRLDPECPEPEFQDDCENFGNLFVGAASTTVIGAFTAFGGGFVAGLTGGAMLPIAGAGVAMTSTAGTAALSFGFAWVACQWSGGDDPCEDDPEEPCEPEPEFMGSRTA